MHAEIAIITAVLLCALAILPGTLGVLMFTNKMAATASGARYIYGKSLWVLILSVVTALVALYLAWQDDSYLRPVFAGSVIVFGGILFFGFFMHTRLLFQPIKKPTFISIEDAIAKFGPDEEVVGVLDRKGRPYAFVARLARRPHIVYQPDGDDPFIMTHCILAHSSMSYAMEDKFNQPDITITAALANNMVFYEKSNQCSIVQMHNESRDKKLPLKTISTLVVKMATWQKLYPESKVWVRNITWRDIFYLKLLARADVIDPESPVMIYPLEHEQDNRLSMKSMVIGVKIGEQTKTYPDGTFTTQNLVQDEVGGKSLVLIAAEGGDYIQVFDREIDGRVLSFMPEGTDGRFRDQETGSLWAPTGLCLDGELKDRHLIPIPHYNKIFWYVWSDFHPGTEIYAPKAA